MAALKNIRLSSDYLYNYTKEFNTIKLILKHGLRHCLNKEKVPYRNSVQDNFIISFCDILPEQADYHKSFYGNYALSFTKEWGIKNGITPLRYIHPNSPGSHVNYIQTKNDIREARKSLMKNNKLKYFLTLLELTKARKKKLFTKDTIEEETSNRDLSKYLDEIDLRFQEKKKKLGTSALTELYNDWVTPILELLEKTINELEMRDAFMRTYQDDFRGTKAKILYDEREWRSVKFISYSDIDTHPTIQIDSYTRGFLPDDYNLKFDLKDLFEILIKNDSEKTELIDYINNELPHLKDAEKLIRIMS